jgi:hypothetical protein
MTLPFSPKEADTHFEQLPVYAAKRSQELNKMFRPYIDVTDNYARLVSRLITLLGCIEPANTQDKVVRDLMADVFDFLYESRDLIANGKLIVTYPLIRRAYESLSLLNLCALDATWADKWQNGKEIQNGDVRKHLSVHPMGEPIEDLKKLYNFFSTTAHPNRKTIEKRRLGEGNKYVLGMIALPDLLAIVDDCITHIELWHWFMLSVTHFYKDKLFLHDPEYLSYGGLCDQTIKEGNKLKKWLVESMPQLEKEQMEVKTQ